MPRWRRWVFEIRAPADDFLTLLERSLTQNGVRVDRAERFDLVARAFGVRGYVALGWADEGLELRVKLKSGLFASPPALERLLLEAGREAQAALTFDKEAP